MGTTQSNDGGLLLSPEDWGRLCKMYGLSSATFTVGGADIHDAGTIVDLNNGQLDPEWSRVNNVVTFSGNPARVVGYISINAPDDGASNYWGRPKLRVSRGGNIIAIIDDLVMQQNTAYDGDATLGGVFFDKNPGANPAYTFEWFNKDNRTATLPPATYSQIALEAIIPFSEL